MFVCSFQGTCLTDVISHSNTKDSFVLGSLIKSFKRNLFSFFNPAAVLSAKEKELAIFYSFSGNSKRVTEIFQKLEHCDISEIKTLEPYNAYDAREDRKKRELPPISPLNIDLDNYRKIVLIFPVWGYTPALPMQSFLRKHSLLSLIHI